MLNDLEAVVPSRSVTVTVTSNHPRSVGVPAMSPLLEMEMPLGWPDMEYPYDGLPPDADTCTDVMATFM